MRVVLYTNIVISALLYQGSTRRFQELWKNHKIKVFATQAVLGEYVRVLHYPKFGYESELITELLQEHLLPWLFHGDDYRGRLVYPSADRDDDNFLRAALSAKAEVLVSGDPDLTDLNGKYDFPILPPGPFLSRYFTRRK